MITLYHGSPFRVEQPLVSIGRPNLDFGQGFYLTRLQRQAETWAQTISGRQKEQPAQAWLNTYSFDFDAAIAGGYRILRLDAYDRRWLDFIAGSRHGEQPWADYDLIEGGVASDKVVDAIEAYLGGLADMEHTLGKLAYAQPNHQICLRNQQLIDEHLKCIDSRLITDTNDTNVTDTPQKGGNAC